MTEPSIALPSELEYGYVGVQIVLAVADTAADEDRLPDARPATGTITLTPVESKRVYTEAGKPVLVGKHPITGTLDHKGRLRDDHGLVDIGVVAGVYNVTYNLAEISVNPHPILVTSDHTQQNPLNLADSVPFDPPATPGQFEILSARIDSIAATDGMKIYDTGWRVLPLESGWANSGASATVGPAIRRIGNVVHVRTRNLTGQDATSPTVMTLPVGFQPEAADGGLAMIGGTIYAASVNTAGALNIIGAHGQPGVGAQGSFTYITGNPWPETLPGTAV